MIILAAILAGLPLLLSIYFFLQLNIPSEKFPPIGVGFKLMAGALSPFWAVSRVIGALIGWVYQDHCISRRDAKYAKEE